MDISKLSLCAVVLFSLAGTASAESALTYTPELQNPVPIPPAEKGLQTVTAEQWFKVSDKGLQLEGAAFDRQGNLNFVDVFGGQVWKLTPDRKLTALLPENKLGSAGIAIHKDGRIFVAGLGNFKDTGSVFAIRPDGSGMETIIPASAGYLVDDLVFDARGGFYFTDFHGTSTNRTGGLFYVAPDMKTITPILPHLAVANGVALSPDGKTLWTNEHSAGLLHKIALTGPTEIAPFGTSVPYYFIGPAPDSMRVDADGNLYVAIYEQGKVMVFNKAGLPIGQILIPGRERGHNLRSTSMAFKPGTNELYILSSDGPGGEGCAIYKVAGFAKGAVLYSHQ